MALVKVQNLYKSVSHSNIFQNDDNNQSVQKNDVKLNAFDNQNNHGHCKMINSFKANQ